MANENDQGQYGYGKRPLWQWIVLYIIIAGVVYGLVYYFFFAKGGYSYGTSNTYNYGTQTIPQNSNAPVSNQTQPTAQPTSAPTPTPVAPAAPKTVSVVINNFAFSPQQLTVKAGTKVTWKNNDSVAHTVTSNSGAFDSGTLNTGASYSFTFSTPGTYSYHCMIHPNMTATVVVTQ